MIQKSQFRTASRIVQLGNTVTWLKNQNRLLQIALDNVNEIRRAE